MVERKRHWYGVCVGVLLAVLATSLTVSALHENQTVDEGAHLAAGYSYWKTGDFRMNPEHPPLIKLLSSVPLLFAPIHLPTDHPSWVEGDEWAFARQLLYHNTLRPETILFLGRLPVMLLTLILAFLVFRASRERWGRRGGLLSLALIALEPTVIAHGHYVTTDLGIALFFLLTILAFERYLERPTRKHLLLVALWFALAQLAKFSATLLLPFLLLRWLLHYALVPRERRAQFNAAHAMKFVAVLLVVTFAGILLCYRWSASTARADLARVSPYATNELWDPDFVKVQPILPRLTLMLTDPDTASGRAVRWATEHLPIPAYPYFKGLTNVLTHSSYGHDSYLMGDYRSLGWVQYFPVAFAVKTPLPTLLLYLTVIALALLPFRRWRQPSDRRTVLLLLFPVGLYFASSMSSALNLGVRHLLPVYPLLAVAAGALMRVRVPRPRFIVPTVLGACILWLGWSSLHALPHTISYFSDVVGGAKNGQAYLTDSNLDWGQELKHLGTVMQERSIPYVHIVYFGQTPLETYIDDFRGLPALDDKAGIAALDGWVAASVTPLYTKDGAFSWLHDYTPALTVGNAIELYDFRKPSP